MSLNWADYVIVGLIGLSAVLSLMRGFIKEALSLLSWIAALWVSLEFAHRLAGLLDGVISVPSVRLAIGFAVLFLGVLLLGALLSYLASQLVQKTGLSGTDRMLGVVFGIIRGGLIVTVLVLLAGLTVLPHDPWWTDSRLLGHFQEFAVWLRGFLPPDIASNIRYD